MILSVYLSSEIKNILSCYGSLDEVVNKILMAGSQGLIDIMEKPPAPEKKGGTYYRINIEEPDYISLIETYGAKSSRISLRRLLYWFVENEIYEELGWEPSEEFVEEKRNKKYEAITELKQALFKIRQYFPQYDDHFEEFKNLLREIEDEVWYAT